MKKILAPVLCVCLSALVFAGCSTDDMMGETSSTGTTQRTSGTTFTTPRATSTNPATTSGSGIISDMSSFLSGLVTDATEPTDNTGSDVDSGTTAGSGKGRSRTHRVEPSDRMNGSAS